MATEEITQKRKVAFEEEDDEQMEEEFYEEEDSEEEEESDDEGDDITDLLANTLATPEGDTLCGTLVQISHTLETQNKILIKLLSAIAKK